MAELVKLVRIVDAVRAFEQSQPYRFYAITDDRTCEACMKYDGDWFSNNVDSSESTSKSTKAWYFFWL